MKRILFTILIFVTSICISLAKPVDEATAAKVAENFLSVNSGRSDIILNTAIRAKIETDNDISATTLYYVFNDVDNKGFIIISADDNSVPVLGYSNTGNFAPDNMPPQVKKWMEGYKKELRYIIENDLQADSKISEQWKNLKEGKKTSDKQMAAVSPLLSTTWDQSPYYNAQCPGGSVSGCVATAMAQIMKYWNYPPQGTGFHSYNEDNYGTLSANFGGTTYNWSSMPNNVSSANSAVATLMYHCGVSVDMDYSPEGSGAYVISSGSPVTHCSEYAFKTYFGYESSLQGIDREDYSDSQWIQTIKQELDAGRPVEYAGFGTGGGHAFVCDGYDNNDYFHFNWGWSGYYDGYFHIDALNPSGTGTGGGTGGFNSGHQAVIGIKPPTGGATDYDIVLYQALNLSAANIYYGQAFSISTNLYNGSSSNFSGDYCAAAFDSEYNFVDFVEIKTDWSLQSGYVYNEDITFTTEGLLSMLPGTYYIGIFYRPSGGNWIQAGDGSFSNLIQIGVYNPNDIELNSDITVSPSTTLKQGEAASVTLNILNDGTSTFYGKYSVDLYNIDGSWVENIAEMTESNGLSAGYTYSDPYLNFNTSAITAPPGTYLLAVMHQPGGSDWQLTGSSYYQNPIFVTIQEASIVADMYENNDSEDKAYSLQINFSGNNASVYTTGSNCHTGSDYDFYRLNLPKGYDYTITARAHDFYNSGNGESYTNDIIWAYQQGGNWSDLYDDVMESSIKVINGGNLVFLVSPFYEGETGTYLMDMQISRVVSTDVIDITQSGQITIGPNPANDYIKIKNNGTGLIKEISIIDINGRTVKNINSIPDTDNMEIPVYDLTAGTYLVKVSNSGTFKYLRFVKAD